MLRCSLSQISIGYKLLFQPVYRALKSYLAQHGYVIDEVVVRLGTHETIAEARFADTDLAFVLLRARHADDGHVELFHCGERT